MKFLDIFFILKTSKLSEYFLEKITGMELIFPLLLLFPLFIDLRWEILL